MTRRPIVIPLLALAAASCSEGLVTPATGVVTTVTIAPASADTLRSIGETLTLQIAARDAGGRVVVDAPVQLSTSAAGVASVSPAGVVTAASNGTATVTARSGEAASSIGIHVRQTLAAVDVKVTGSRIAVGRSAVLTAAPTDALGNPMAGLPAATFASSNEGVATVDGAGSVTGVSAGTAQMTVSVTSPADGTTFGRVDVLVVQPASSATVSMTASTFTPAQVDVERSGSVTFVNGSGILHDVDFGIAALDIDTHGSGSNTRAFPNAGTFPYHCNLHAGMTGTVFVH